MPVIDLSTLSMTEIVRLQTLLQHELTRRFEQRLALVFSDIVGSTPYFARHGDAIGHRQQQLHADLLAQCCEEHGGRIVDTAGDGIFCVFPSATAAVDGVMALQRRIATENAGQSRVHQLSVRIGLHWGAVLADGTLVTGNAVNTAAHVAQAAVPGMVLLTRDAFLELGPAQRLLCRPRGEHLLKGAPEPVALLALDWRDAQAFPRRVRIHETREEIELPLQDVIGFGRLREHEGLPANDVVLHHPDPERQRRISRWHFELRRGLDGLLLRCLSDGGTAVDGEPVSRGQDAPVRSGSTVRVAGVLTLHFEGPAEAAADQGTLMVLNETVAAPPPADDSAPSRI